MRACFMGPTVCALGYGVAILQTPSMEVEAALEQESSPAQSPDFAPDEVVPTDYAQARELILKRERAPTLA
jgi:hypothetical protein